MSEINKRTDGIICGTKDFCCVICSNVSYQNVIENINYCILCVKTSKILDTVDEFEHICNPENNDKCESAFEKGGDEDDIASAA